MGETIKTFIEQTELLGIIPIGLAIYLLITWVKHYFYETWEIFKYGRYLPEAERGLPWHESEPLNKEAAKNYHRNVIFSDYMDNLKPAPLGMRYDRALDWLLNAINHLTQDKLQVSHSSNKGTWPYRWFGVNPFTEGSYLLCLRIAFFYPFILFMLGWCFGGAGKMVGITFFDGSVANSRRWLSLVAILFCGQMLYRIYRKTGWLSFMWLAGVGSVAVSYSVSGHVASAVAGAFAFAFTFAGALSFVGAAESFCNHFKNTKRSHYWITFNVASLSLLALVMVVEFDVYGASKLELIPFFLGLFPLLNALFDWFSLGFTRGLLYAIRKANHDTLQIIGWGLLNIFLAIICMLGIIGSTTFAIAAVNGLSYAFTGNGVMNLNELLSDLKEHPLSPDSLWIHFMMITTFIPTLLHFAMVSFIVSPITWGLKSEGKVEAVCGNQAGRRRVFYRLILGIPLVSIVFPAIFVAAMFYLLKANDGFLAVQILDMVVFIADSVDPTVDKAEIFPIAD